MTQRKTTRTHEARGSTSVLAPRLLTINGAAQQLALSRSTVYRLIREGQLRTVHVFKRRMVPQDAIEELLDLLARRLAARAR